MTSNNGGNGRVPAEGEGLLTFPCEVDIKVFVAASEKVDQHVQALLLIHLEPDQVLAIRRKVSRKGNYHSLSCRVLARGRQELDAVYRTLSDHPDILMVI